MATTHDPRSTDAQRRARLIGAQGPRRLRWTSDQFYRLGQRGFFRDKRVELIKGNIILTSPISPVHAAAVELLDRALRIAFGPGHRFRVQQPIDLGKRAQPEPDIVVMPGDPRDNLSGHPTTALLIAEISDTSLRFDRRVKARLYAQAGLTDYWIVNLVDRQVEIHRNPKPVVDRQGRSSYQDITIVSASGSVQPLAAPGATIAVADLLP
ncbi:MAG TPA: Uma2 family endonuclease [Isosphaeraceae bacterium]|jgi:Uma2 family endonuclease|nr:Uma2 family endonuclease [Isosphaeraceae bacterium]